MLLDTDNAFVDGKFKPSVAGYYQVNGSVAHVVLQIQQDYMLVYIKMVVQVLKDMRCLLALSNLDTSDISLF